jgi:hypothetical protein
MSRSLVRAGFFVAAGLFALATVDTGALTFAPGARADEYSAPVRPRRHARRQARRGELKSGSTPAEIARYFQLYGGYLDPAINKQSQGGPFDSGFFFDSGIGKNGGDSPYMN